MSDTFSQCIKVGSRKSELAIKQSNMVIGMLKDLYPEKMFTIKTMDTLGDKILDKELSKIGSKSLFTKELEVALEEGKVHFVVHSLKDLPTTLPAGLIIGAICKRADPRDAVIMHPKFKDSKLKDLPTDSVIGTSSLRRISQLRISYPHLKFENIRGNLNTRLTKLDDGDLYAGIVLAAAGIARMNWEDRISQYLIPSECMYAVGQGALAVECRENDLDIIRLLKPINDPNTLCATIAERAFMKSLEGGCSVPLGVHCEVMKGSIFLKGGVWSLDGRQEILSELSSIFSSKEGDTNQGDEPPKKKVKSQSSYCGIIAHAAYSSNTAIAYDLGTNLATKLIDKGAKKILDQIRMIDKN